MHTHTHTHTHTRKSTAHYKCCYFAMTCVQNGSCILSGCMPSLNSQLCSWFLYISQRNSATFNKKNSGCNILLHVILLLSSFLCILQRKGGHYTVCYVHTYTFCKQRLFFVCLCSLSLCCASIGTCMYVYCSVLQVSMQYKLTILCI